MNFIKDLLEMGEYEEDSHKSYDKEDEAKEHAKEFLDKASEVLSHNKKKGDTDEVTRLALQFAKDYHNAICDAINGEKYNGKDKDADVKIRRMDDEEAFY